MVLLIHHPILPQCRKIRLQMSEKKILFVLKEEVFLEFQWIVKHFFRIHVEHRFKAGEMWEEL